MKLSPNSRRILELRYLRHLPDGGLESPEDLLHRVANVVASAESAYGHTPAAWSQAFFNMMDDRDFLPNSPTLMNAGGPLGQLSACFVLPVPDSLDGIIDTLHDAVLIFKSGGGVGYNFSHLRPQGDVVLGTDGVAGGPLTFIRIFDITCGSISQGFRRPGASMASLRVNHPDILSFIRSKRREGDIPHFNLSVILDDAFMEAVRSDGAYSLVNPRNGEVSATLPARTIFDEIIESMWLTGEPGVIFIDAINAANPTPHLGAIESTNPCGEMPLLPYESCNLGSINLANMLTEAPDLSPDFNWAHLKNTVHLAVRFLDDVIDVNRFPLPTIDVATERTRKIGLGVMGWADALVMLGIPYDSEEAISLAHRVMSFINNEAHIASVELAGERGMYPACSDGCTFRRNATCTTIAPTGTIALIAGVSSGIEPIYALCYQNNTELGKPGEEAISLYDVNYLLLRALEAAIQNGTMSPMQRDRSLDDVKKHGSLRGLHDSPDSYGRVAYELGRTMPTALDISPTFHIQMQAAFQAHVDNAVSKTINLRSDATPRDINGAIFEAWKMHCKGLTVYRDGSRSTPALQVGVGSGPVSSSPQPDVLKSLDIPSSSNIVPRARPGVVHGSTYRARTGCGNLYITVNSDEIGPCEVFAMMGKTGGCAMVQSEAISRLVSMALRSGVSPESIIKQLSGIRCPSPALDSDLGTTILSCPHAMAVILAKCLDIDIHNPSMASLANHGGMCPDCSGMLVYEGGCYICKECGFTRCG